MEIQETLNKTFTSEKVILLSFIGKDLIAESAISITDYLSRLFWDGFKDLILSQKSLPVKHPYIQFIYRSYDDKFYSAKIITTALRDKTRGRRSAEFHAKQLEILTECKKNYVNQLIYKIKMSGMLFRGGVDG